MEIKAYSFEQNQYAYAEVKRKVAEKINVEGVYFNSFSDPKELFEAINNDLDTADVVLIGIESKVYLKFKPVLIKAFGYTPAYSDKIKGAMDESISDEKLKKAHSLVPDESKELLSEDGLYSGFYVKENDQYIVVFPLLERLLPEILMVPDLPFFKAPENKSVVFDAILEDEVASTKAERIVEKLKKNDFTLAIPTTPASKLLKSDIKACEDYSSRVFFTPFVNDTGIDDPKQYTAQLAKSAMDLRSATMGAIISNIFREKKGDKVLSYYTFISVATEEKIVVKKLYADPDEKIDNLVIEATNELYNMIEKYVDEIAFKLNASPEDLENYEKSLIEAEVVSDVRPEASISKKGAIAIIIALIAAIVVCAVLAFKYGGYFVKPSDKETSENLQAGAPTVEITIPSTTEPTTKLPVADLGDLTSTTTDLFGVSTTISSEPVQYPHPPMQIVTTAPHKKPNNKPTKEETEAEKPTKKPTEKPTKAPETEPTTEENTNHVDW